MGPQWGMQVGVHSHSSPSVPYRPPCAARTLLRSHGGGSAGQALNVHWCIANGDISQPNHAPKDSPSHVTLDHAPSVHVTVAVLDS